MAKAVRVCMFFMPDGIGGFFLPGPNAIMPDRCAAIGFYNLRARRYTYCAVADVFFHSLTPTPPPRTVKKYLVNITVCLCLLQLFRVKNFFYVKIH